LIALLTVNLAAMDNPTVVKMKNAGLPDDHRFSGASGTMGGGEARD
jgi:hypothetical protein